MKQRTLKSAFSVAGKGLHSGLNIEASFNPAPENHGIKFERIDLEGSPIIEALAENVVDTLRGTVIGRGEARVSTIEHALASLYAAGIDNCLIKVNAPELPILDGSAKLFAEKIAEVGFEEQAVEKNYYIVKQKIELIDENTGSSFIILPDDHFSIDTMVEFKSPVLNNQFASLNNLDRFNEEIAGCRTFVFVREIMPLVNAKFNT